MKATHPTQTVTSASHLAFVRRILTPLENSLTADSMDWRMVQKILSCVASELTEHCVARAQSTPEHLQRVVRDVLGTYSDIQLALGGPRTATRQLSELALFRGFGHDPYFTLSNYAIYVVEFLGEYPDLEYANTEGARCSGCEVCRADFDCMDYRDLLATADEDRPKGPVRPFADDWTAWAKLVLASS